MHLVNVLLGKHSQTQQIKPKLLGYQHHDTQVLHAGITPPDWGASQDG